MIQSVRSSIGRGLHATSARPRFRSSSSSPTRRVVGVADRSSSPEPEQPGGAHHPELPPVLPVGAHRRGEVADHARVLLRLHVDEPARLDGGVEDGRGAVDPPRAGARVDPRPPSVSRPRAPPRSAWACRAAPRSRRFPHDASTRPGSRPRPPARTRPRPSAAIAGPAGRPAADRARSPPPPRRPARRSPAPGPRAARASARSRRAHPRRCPRARSGRWGAARRPDPGPSADRAGSPRPDPTRRPRPGRSPPQSARPPPAPPANRSVGHARHRSVAPASSRRQGTAAGPVWSHHVLFVTTNFPGLAPIGDQPFQLHPFACMVFS
jgi:hypothetical protein